MAETGSTSSERRSPEADGSTPEADGSAGGDRPLVCNVAFCPICLAVTAAQGAAPETVEHLLKAAREFFLAARAVIDVRGDHLDGERKASPTFEKIDIG